jgi:murein DD-endopeptidase MepM/ murein hydrolase activator NlpD
VPGAAFGLSAAPAQGRLLFGTAPRGTLRLTLDGRPVALAPDRRFLIAFDRDAGPRSILSAEMRGGRSLSETLEVASGQWQIEHVDVPLRPAIPTDEYLRIRKVELARIAAARLATGSVQGWRQHFIWPARARISGVFGSQRTYRGGEAGSFHAGVDIAAPAGTAVVAPADGVVVLAGPPAFTLEGNLVIVDHGMGLNSAFLHLSASVVHVGQRVRQGETIGFVGATGRATGPHLHWAMRWQEARIDPAPLAGAMPPSATRPGGP